LLGNLLRYAEITLLKVMDPSTPQDWQELIWVIRVIT